MLFKLKGIMAFPEAADAVEVSVAASTAKGGILIADAAPGELLFLFLRPGGHGLGLRLCPAGLVLELGSWPHRDVKATCLIQGSFFGELPQDSLDGLLFLLFIIAVWKVVVLEGHLKMEGREQGKRSEVESSPEWLYCCPQEWHGFQPHLFQS